MIFRILSNALLLFIILIGNYADAGILNGLYTPANNASIAANGQILKYDSTTGVSVDMTNMNLGDSQIQGMTLGPDGLLYASAFNTSSNTNGRIVRFDLTGQLIDTFVVSENGGLISPSGLTFGPDGNLYVINNNGWNPGQILRYDGKTGAFKDVFATGLIVAQDIVFGPDGDLYLSNGLGDSIGRYNGTTGAFFGYFVHRTLGFQAPIGMTFGPSGDLYVASFPTNTIFRFGAETGEVISRFVLPNIDGYDNQLGIAFQYNTLLDIAFGPDQKLYAAMRGYGTEIIKLDPNTGVIIDQFATLQGPSAFNTGMLFIDPGCAQLGLTAGISSGCFLPSAVPEPDSLYLLILALSGLAAFIRSRRSTLAKTSMSLLVR